MSEQLYYTFDDGRSPSWEGPMTAEDAAHELLTLDSYVYEIRREDGACRLYHSQGSSCSSGGAGKLLLCPKFTGETEEEVYRKVAEGWEEPGHYALTVEQYERQIAEEADHG